MNRNPKVMNCMHIFLTLWIIIGYLVGIRAISTYQSKVAALRSILNQKDFNSATIMPCCYDGLTAKLVERAGFNVTFMTGFGVSAVHGLPDTGLISVEEMAITAATICRSISIPCIGDGDTGYGNPINVKQTVKRYIQAGLSGIMIEDQVAPKRCGHTKGKKNDKFISGYVASGGFIIFHAMLPETLAGDVVATL
eukprot:gene13176-17654_t